MNLRELLTAARTAGWHHIVYATSFGREHIWRHGDTSVHLEQICEPAGSVYTELTVVKNDRQVVAGRVDNLDQVVRLLAAYDLVDQSTVENLRVALDNHHRGWRGCSCGWLNNAPTDGADRHAYTEHLAEVLAVVAR